MTQKSLVYMVLAVAVGYLLVSTVPQQVALYTTPPLMTQRGDGEFTADTVPESGDTFTGIKELPESSILGETDELREISFMERSRLPELMKWWTIDILVALTIYWVARQRLS